jgi:hypothetical protein
VGGPFSTPAHLDGHGHGLIGGRHAPRVCLMEGSHPLCSIILQHPRHVVVPDPRSVLIAHPMLARPHSSNSKPSSHMGSIIKGPSGASNSHESCAGWEAEEEVARCIRERRMRSIFG